MQRDKITILDAGMGKTLSMKGVEIPPTIWSANALIVAPEMVLEIHRENISAGARMITTNSYGIIPADLRKEGLEEKFVELNQSAGQLAQKAARESVEVVEVAGSLPPLNGSYRPDRVLRKEIVEPIYRQQSEALCPYVDIFLCETLSTIQEAVSAVSVTSELGKPVLVGLTLHDDQKGKLRSGESLQDAIYALKKLNPAGILANCSLPERISDAMPILVESGLSYRGGYANAFCSVPKDWLLDGEKDTDGKLELRKDLSPERYREFVIEWVEKGANFIGGCCGTTAEHISLINEWIEGREC
tara:strand:- start:5377 stop:6282 length:906 start_codon:yes stop_codon:yes gene_type:complete